ncbi:MULTISPECIES: hypothetical protein [Pedobacter]|uniref:hypothetical protein n=1 Tax=Pedobacter TaxID=84567 RepID=UPI00064A495B|nr:MULTISPECIES: hypothetical protein [Pedobacter]KLT64772.1 hypothetical protein AB669_13595 [Pedobacter sp. BMA]
MKKSLLLFFMALLCTALKAQYPYYEDDRLRIGVQIGADYDSPLGELKYIYKPAISPNISVLLSQNDRFSANITVGHHVYQPRAEAFYYLLDDGENYGIDTFTQYKVTSIYLGFLYHIRFTDVIKGLAGLNFGIYKTDYETTSTDPYQSSFTGIADRNVYIAPKLGVSFAITESIALNVLAKYNLYSPTGNNDNFTPAIFHKDLGKVFTAWSVGTGISYQF